MIKKIAVNTCRLLLAATFIVSGFVKAVDPIGTQYKITDYLGAFGINGETIDIVALLASMGLSALEFTLGVCLLFTLHIKWTVRLTTLFMAVMTPLTLWLAIADPISDCGCFGDAITLTNWQTFAKNVLLAALAVIVMRVSHLLVRPISKANEWIVVNYTVVYILALSNYSLYKLPPFDFRPYHIGANIKRGMEIPEGAKLPKLETTFILEKDGHRKTFTLDDYPDSTWTFIDSKTVEVEKGYEPPIHDFSIVERATGNDITDEVLDDKGYTFLLIAPHLEKADDGEFDEINMIYEYAKEHNYRFYCLTASSDRGTAMWRDMTGADYPFCTTDETTLKTIVRGNPGLVLIKDATVVNKWSNNELPTEKQLNGQLERLDIGKPNTHRRAEMALGIVLWFAIPLLLLTLADRLWAWSKWIRRKEETNKIYQLLTKRKTMRKKIVAGNWKMNMNLQDGVALAKELNETLTAEKPNCGVVICTPFIHLASIAQFLNQDIIGLGAENCADKEKGAYTGEVSAEMVKSTGAQYVILGHSERRGYYGETPEILKEKVQLALKNDLKVIFCIGESLEEREANKQNEVVKAELEGSVFNLSEEDFRKIVIAYEPIWAIGTGKTATADQAEEIHAYIRSTIAEKYGAVVADDTTILYGGSCKASNAPELFAKPDIDGGLIGGASLKAADFKGIIDAWKK